MTSTPSPSPTSWRSSSNSAISWPMSSAAVGSSSRRSRGIAARARATRTRCHSPPESVSMPRSSNPVTSQRASAPAIAASSSAVIAAVGPSLAQRPINTTSRTVSGNAGSSRCGSAPITPASARRVHVPMSRSSRRTTPDWVRVSPSSVRSNVVLPLPLGPTTATSSPPDTPKDTSARAGTAAPGYWTVTLDAASLIAGFGATAPQTPVPRSAP